MGPSFARETDCLPEEAVRCEPVSGANSLLTGKLTGNFEKFGASAPISHSIDQQIQKLAAEFPTQETGNFQVVSGILSTDSSRTITAAAPLLAKKAVMELVLEIGALAFQPI